MEPRPSAPRGEELLGHGRFLRSLARALTADPGRAEDLVQDTWVAALERPPRHGSAPRAWLARILRSKAIKRGLREAERAPREQAAELADRSREEDPHAIAAEIELSRQVLECVEALDEPYRSTLYLRYYRALTPLAIADEQDVPVKTVKTRLARGLERMRAELDRRHAGRREAWMALLLPLARAPLEPALPAPEAAGPLAAAGLPAGLVAAGLALAVATAWWLVPDGDAPPGAPASDRAAVPVAVAESAPSLGFEAGRRASTPLPAEPGTPAPAVARLRGRAVDVQGEPLPAVDVRVTRTDPRSRGRAGDALDDVHVLTGTDGAFELELAEPGLVAVVLGLDGHAPAGRRLAVFLGQDLDLGEVALEAGVSLAGRVIDELGRPVPEARLYTWREDEGLVLDPGSSALEPAGSTDASGRFRVARQAVGAWRLRVLADGYLPGSASGETTRSGEVADAVEVVLVPDASIAGRVRGLAPAELERVLVVASRTDGRDEGPEAPVAAPGVDGAFELRGLRVDEEVELLVVDSGGRRGRVLGAARRARGGEVGVDLFPERPEERRARGAEVPPGHDEEVEGEPAGSVQVRVVTPGGAPAAGALVLRRGESRWPPGLGPDGLRVVAADGLAAWTELGPGVHEFRAIHGAFGLSDARGDEGWRQVSLSEGESVELRLEVPPLGRLAGRVVADGAPVVDARVLVRPAGPGEGWRGGVAGLVRRTDAGGRFDFGALPVGAYRLELDHPERVRLESVDTEVTVSGRELVVELPDARLVGVVRDPEGAPVAGARVRVLQEGPWRRARAASTDAEGRFELRGLQPGTTARLEVAAAGRATLQTQALAIDVPHRLTLAPEASLVLDLRSLSGEPFHRVTLRGPGGEVLVFLVTAGVPRTLDGLGAGTWSLAVDASSRRGPRDSRTDDERELVREVVLTAGDVARLAVEVP